MDDDYESDESDGRAAEAAEAAEASDAPPPVPEGYSPLFYQILQDIRDVSAQNPLQTGPRSWSVRIGSMIIEIPDAATAEEAMREARVEEMRAREEASMRDP